MGHLSLLVAMGRVALGWVQEVPAGVGVWGKENKLREEGYKEGGEGEIFGIHRRWEGARKVAMGNPLQSWG